MAGSEPMAMAQHPDEAYDRVIGRVSELEVDMAQAVQALERAHADNLALKDVHADLVAAYSRVQEQHQRLRHLLVEEQEERYRTQVAHGQQLATYRAQLQARERDIEDLQDQMMSPTGPHAAHLRALEESDRQSTLHIRALEEKLEAERRQVAHLQHQVAFQRQELEQRDTQQEEERLSLAEGHRQREQALRQQMAALEAQAKGHSEVEANAEKTRVQMQLLEAKIAGLQKTLEEQERQGERERQADAEQRKALVEEAGVVRRRAHELQVQLEQQETRLAKLSSDHERVQRENSKLKGELEQSEAARKAIAQLPASDERRPDDGERERLGRALRAAEDRAEAAAQEARRAEAKAQRAQDDLAQHAREAQQAREDAERAFEAEKQALQLKLDAAEKEAEERRKTYRDRELQAQRQLEEANSRADAAADELADGRSAQEELQGRLRRAEQEGQRASAELPRLQARVSQLEAEGKEQATAVVAARNQHQKLEERCRALEAELTTSTARHDAERASWSRDADAVQAAAQRAEEQRHAAAMQQQAQEHARQMAKLQAAAKKALRQAAAKRKEQKQKVYELARRVDQLRHEKATAVRVCEENKKACELRLHQLGMAAGCGGAAPPPEAPGWSDDLRGVSERLERQKAWLRSRGSAPGESQLASEPIAAGAHRELSAAEPAAAVVRASGSTSAASPSGGWTPATRSGLGAFPKPGSLPQVARSRDSTAPSD